MERPWLDVESVPGEMTSEDVIAEEMLMEFLEGEALADERIAQAPKSLKEALTGYGDDELPW